MMKHALHPVNFSLQSMNPARLLDSLAINRMLRGHGGATSSHRNLKPFLSLETTPESVNVDVLMSRSSS